MTIEKNIVTAFHKIANRRSPGLELIGFLNKFSDEWRTSITNLLFKKGDKNISANYRGINLLNTTLKLTKTYLLIR